jgi:hypothetical protein
MTSNDFLGMGQQQKPFADEQQDGVSTGEHGDKQHAIELLSGEDTYCDEIKSILRSADQDDRKETFERLFLTRYGIKPLIVNDGKLVQWLSKSSSTNPTEGDWMFYTQRHFNEFGGFPGGLSRRTY